MKRKTNIIAVSAFLVATLLVMLISSRNRQRLQSGFISLISPLLKVTANANEKIKTYTTGTKTLAQLEAENTQLTTEAARLRAENQMLHGLEADNLRLRKALGYETQSPFSLISARVIGRPGANWWNAVMLDKGKLDGVDAEMCVLTADGLVGKVVLVADHSATVLLVTDENCKVAVRVGDSSDPGRLGIVQAELRGDLQGDRVSTPRQPQMVLSYLGKYVHLEKGQEIFTTGAGQVYPAGVMVGRVVESHARELDKQAIIEPSVDLVDLTDVFVVTGMKGVQAQK